MAKVSESVVAAADGTKLYVRERAADSASPGAIAAPSAGAVLPVTAIFCDGIACDGFIWKYLWDEVAARMPVAHWHYRGHGRSGMPVDPSAITIEHHADDLNHVRDHLGDPPVVLFGHSMGVQVVLEAYRQRRDKVRAMVLVCGTYGRITDTFKGTNLLTQVLPTLIDQVGAAPSVARAIWSRIPPELSYRIGMATGELDKSIRREDIMPYLQHMTHMDLPMFLRMLRAAGEHDARDVLPEVACALLVVAGERDSFTPAYLAQEMADKVPNAELMVVPNGTHVAPLEYRELVHLRIDKFLRDRALP